MPLYGTHGMPDLGLMTTAVLRASACCIEVHVRRHMFSTNVDGGRIGVSCGPVAIFQIGGVVPPEMHVA